MAAFDEIKVTRDMDLDALKKKFYKLSEDLKYMFSNLDEDNFSKEFLDHMEQRGNRLREISFSSDGLRIRFEDFDKGTTSALEMDEEKISLLVSRGDVVSTLMSRLELYGEKIVITGNRLIINAKNITLDRNGNVTFSGQIIGGSININNRFMVDQQGNAIIDGSLEIGLLNPRDSVYCGELEVDNSDDYVINIAGTITANYEVYISEDLTCQRVRYSSDGTKKEEVGPVPAAEILAGLRPVSFRFTDGPARIGFIAQDVYRLQEALGGELPLVSRHGPFLDLPMDSYGAVFAGAIQDNQRRIDRLRDRIRERREKDVIL